jgi:hypothetical protein
MNTSTIILIVLITVIWVWISYILYNAPEMDEDGNFIDNIDEGEVYEELYRRNDEKEDVK